MKNEFAFTNIYTDDPWDEECGMALLAVISEPVSTMAIHQLIEAVPSFFSGVQVTFRCLGNNELMIEQSVSNSRHRKEIFGFCVGWLANHYK